MYKNKARIKSLAFHPQRGAGGLFFIYLFILLTPEECLAHSWSHFSGVDTVPCRVPLPGEDKCGNPNSDANGDDGG